MTDIMMMLGMQYQFCLSTAAYQNLRHAVEYRWPAQERIGRAPARQFVGVGNETVELDGTIHPHFAGGLDQIKNMRAIAGDGVPLRLVDGRGFSWGRFCIERIEETQTVLMSNGDPLRIEFRLNLAAYGEDA